MDETIGQPPLGKTFDLMMVIAGVVLDIRDG